MQKDGPFRDHPDPEYQRWHRTYPRFPGVPECVQLILARMTRGTWDDIIVQQLADNAGDCLSDLVGAYRSDPGGDIRLFVMMALDLARPPEAVGFLAEVLRSRDPRYHTYARRALEGIGTLEARTALWDERPA